MARVKGDKYSRKYAKQLKNGLRADGKSINKVCQLWDITRTTYNYWIEHYPEFKTAAEIGQRDFCVFLEDQAMKLALGEVKGNAGMMIFALKNAEGMEWKDKVETNITSDETIHRINISILPPPDQKPALPNPKVIDVEPEDG